jgi:multisubunit Na+/H+ antiporter MnhF subunit
VTVTEWAVSAAVLTAGVLVCGLAASRRPVFEALVALELAGTLATLSLVCLTVASKRAVYGDVPIIAAVMNWVGSLVYVRFLDRSRG